MLLGNDIFNERFGTVLARTTPWTQAELARIRQLAAERGDGVAYAPGGPYRLEWAELAKAPGWKAFCEGYRLDVCPPTDDKPFFFNMTRLGDIASPPPDGYFYGTDPIRVLALTLALLLVLCAVAFGLPIALVPRGRRPPARTMAFFAAIGLGFLMLEIALIQRLVLFLGFPTYALSVVLFSLLLSTGLGSLRLDALARSAPHAHDRARRRVPAARGRRVRAPAAAARADRAAVPRPRGGRRAAARAGRARARDGDADRAHAARRAAPGRGAVGVGGQRRRLRARVGRRGGGGDHLRLHRR